MSFLRLVLLAASAQALALVPSTSSGEVQPSLDAAQARAIGGCTTNSFSVSSWFIHNFTFSKSDDSATFHLLNRANNYTANLACANSTASNTTSNLWAHCSIVDSNKTDASLTALVRVTNSRMASILLSQTWSCNDRNTTRPIKFSATGNSSVALNSAGSGAYTAVDSPLLVRGSLVSPVAITPAYAEGPVGHAKAGCAAAAKSPPEWTLQTVYYLNQTGDDGETSIASQSLMLQVVNPAIGYQAGCVGFLPNDLSAKPTAFTCSGQGFDFIGKDRYRITTQALFEPAMFRFTVNQTWYCDDEDPGKPVSITASGSMELPLNCTSVPINGRTPDKPGNKTTCVSTGDITLKGKQPGVVTPLPPYSITDPLPTPDGCTVSSIVSPAWIFSSFELDRAANGSTGGNSTSVGFDIKFSTGTNEFTYPVSIFEGGEVDAPSNSELQTQWYACKFGPDELPLVPYNCSYTYDAVAKQVTLAAEWICSDLDKKHPILFSGTSTTTVAKPLSCSTAAGLSQCLTDQSDTWNVPVTGVTWQKADPSVLAPS